MFLFIAVVMLYSCKGSDTVEDVDGNVYHTIKIGEQVWMVENLKATRYRNGDALQHAADSIQWKNSKAGAYCNYNNDSSHVKNYGRLYNSYAVKDSRGLAPDGWHIPGKEEINTLIDNLKGDTVAAAKLKEAGLQSWIYPNAGASNESGFTARPGGYRFGTGTFHTLGSNGYWWTTTSSFEVFAWSPRVFTDFADVNRDERYLAYGLSVRCIKD